MATLAEVGVDLGPTDRLFIDGAWVNPLRASSFDVINPADESVLFKAAKAGPEDIDAAVSAARVAFDHGPWPWLSPAERAVYLNAIADEFDKRLAEASHLWTTQVGVLPTISSMVAPSWPGAFRSHADLASTYPFVERHEPSMGSGVGMLVREPVGVVATIIPWNSPMIMITAKVAPALLAGCTVVVKMSSESPGDGYLLAQLVEAAGLPPGVVNVVTADRQVSELLVRDPRVDKVSFTGSTAVGRRIGGILAERIGRLTLELGGKSPAVVFDDADVDLVADLMSGGIPGMCGQGCSLLTRAVVTRSRHDELVEALVARFGAIRVGDPYAHDTEMGPLASRTQRDRVESYVAKGRAEGAVLAVGGGRPAHLERGYFLEPTVFADVDSSATIAQEEIFGPVITVVPARDDAHAIELANDTIYGLNASVFTADPERGYAAARQLRAGSVGVNTFVTDFGIAFGGFKQSGLGREGGREGVFHYLETKTIIVPSEVEASRSIPFT